MNDEMKWASELKEQHPEVLKYYSPHEIKLIWSDYSKDSAAGWLSHLGLTDYAIKRIFDNYMIVNHWQIWKKI